MTKAVLDILGLANANLSFTQQQAALVERCRNAANNMHGPEREISEELHAFTVRLREARNNNEIADVLSEIRAWAMREDVSEAVAIS